MINAFQIGEIIEVRGTRVKIQVEKNMNHATFLYFGEVIHNITVNAFIIIKQGNIDIVGKIDAEYIVDLQNDKGNMDKDNRFTKGTIKRILEVQIVGFIDSKFNNGIKKLPMIGNIAYIPTNREISAIYSGNKIKLENNDSNNVETIEIGTTIFEEVPVELPINSFFASHVGIFGNTGSGKSNTLARFYFELFQNISYEKMKGKSKFYLLDFNGEYTKENMFGLSNQQKKTFELNTRVEDGPKLQIKEEVLFNTEVLSILFNATEQTQKPFINRVIKGISWAEINGFELKQWAPRILRSILTSVSITKEAFDLFKETINELFSKEESKVFMEKIGKISWHSMVSKLFVEGTGIYFDTGNLNNGRETHSGITECEELMSSYLNKKSTFNLLIFRFRMQLISDLLKKHAQFDHINPLINRAKSRIKELERVIEITKVDSETNSEEILNIISMRYCNVEIKKIVPMLVAKMIFDQHKNDTKQAAINKTVHLIIDEAHNILSAQSNREAGEWKDYRLDLFEEIIKEGRKFGFFLTLASQRPSDISPTIISQVHNFFIHRLVNNKDLELLDNTISTLDRVSKMSIPTLSSGTCIITGTAFVMPVFAKIHYLKESEYRPSSDNVDLLSLWKDTEIQVDSKIQDIIIEEPELV